MIRRIMLGLVSLAVLGGCASNCNVLSDSNSTECNVGMGAGLILAAPIVAPAVLLSDAAEGAKAKRMAREWQSNMQTRLSQADIQAAQECLVGCLYSWQYELDQHDRWALSHQAALLYLAGSWTAENSRNHTAYSVLAHYMLSWQPEGTQEENKEEAPSRIVYGQAKHAYALLKEKSTRTRLRSLLRSNYYSRVLHGIYSLMYVGSLPADGAAAQNYFKDCPKEIQKIMLEERDSYRKISVCSSAYFYRYGQRVPDSLLDLWRVQQKKEARL